MTNTETARAREILARRRAALIANSEDVRNTVAWREYRDEAAQVERSIAFSNWASR